MARKTKIRKSGTEKAEEQKLFRLTEIDPEYVSLVRAGANRQKAFMVVKEDDADEIPEDFNQEGLVDYLAKLTGSPRNRFGTHSSYKFKGDYAHAWKLHFSQHAGGKPDATSTGPLRGTVRRVEMIAATLKPACKLTSTDSIEARSGDKSPLPGSYPETPGDYGLSAWDKPETDADREGIVFSCSDLEVIKRAALAEIKRRAADAEEEAKACGGGKKPKKNDLGGDPADPGSTGKTDGSDGTDGDGTPPPDAIDLASWLDEAGEHVEDLSLDHAIQRALDAQSDGQASDDGAAKGVKEIDDEGTVPPAVSKVGDEAQGEEKHEAEIAKLQAELEETRSELRKARRELTSLKARVARLSKGVGTSSVMLTGEVTAKGTQHTDAHESSPSRGAFLSGGDIAAAVVDD